ncbi:MAG TPA: hypothetical protein ENK20_03845, partial [Chromatiales bacterium]|nr:hypothetical protein [Chromatiales bacterium]
GDRAQVVVANPAGITCDGCGFINASRATLTTGTPVVEEGRLEGYRVVGGTVRIEGAGLDAREADHTALIARAVEVRAGVWARELTVAAGAGAYDAGGARTGAAPGAGGAPAFAIDVAALGGMYAGKIRLIVTEAGAGVRNAGTLEAGAGGLVLTADGRLVNAGTLAASGDVRLEAGAVETTGTVRAGGAARATAAGALVQAGTMSAAGGVRLEAGGGLETAPGSVTAAGVDGTGRAAAPAELVLEAGGTLRLRGRQRAGGALRAAGAAVDLSGTEAVAGGDLAADARTGGLDVRGATLRAAGTLRLRAAGAIGHAGADSAGAALEVTAAGLDNAGGRLAQTGTGPGRIAVAGTLANAGGTVASRGALTVAAGGLDNVSGRVVADGGLTLDLGAGGLDNRGGLLSSAAVLAVRALPGTAVPNAGGEALAGVRLELRDAAFEGGRLLSEGDAVLRFAGAWRHAAELVALGDVDAAAGGPAENAGLLRAGGRLRLGAPALANAAGAELSGARTRLEVAGLLDNRGLIDGDAVRVEAGALDNRGGGRLYGGTLAVAVAGALRNLPEAGAAPAVAARARLDLGVGELLNGRDAVVFSLGDLALGGALDGAARAAGRAARVLNEGGAIEARGALRLAAERVENRNAGLVTREAADPPVYEEWVQPRWSATRYPRASCWGIGGGQDKNGCAGHAGLFEDYTWYRVWVARTRTVVEATAPGRILAGGDLSIEAGRVENADSHIVAGGALDIAAATVDHRATRGRRVVRYEGESAYTWVESCGLFGSKHCRRWTAWVPYTPAPQVEAVYDLPTLRVAAGAAPAGSGTDPGARTPAALDRGAETAPGAAPAPELVLPPSALVVAAPDPAGPYLETDPRFADRGRWLSSDYLLGRLGLDPAAVQRRLGDGLIEQRLVREQLLALRGRLPAPDPRDGEAWWRALLEAGATVARRLGLRPGIALTPEQVAALTSDIVWLVERTVRLPDGRTVRALVPQVYVVPRPGDLDGRGALLAGRTLDLALSGEGRLGGTVAGRRIVVRAEELLQAGRLAAGDEAVLAARGDLRVEGGRLEAGGRLALEAGRDLAVASTVRRTEAGGGRYTRTRLERVARLHVTGGDGRGEGLLSLAAGRDLRLVAADLRNDARGGLVAVTAGRDLALEARTAGWSERTVWDDRNRLVQGERRAAGTRIEAAGDAALAAGRELTARAARVRAGGHVALSAGEGLRLEAGARERWWEEARHRRSRGLLGGSERTSLARRETREAEAAVVSAGSVTARTGGDLVLRGAAVAADGDVGLSAAGDLRLEAAPTARRELRIERRRRSGVFRGPGLGLTVGRERLDARTATRAEGAAPSAVGSLGGDVRLRAGGAYRQRGGSVAAPGGDVAIEAAEVEIAPAEARRETRWSERREVRGLSVSVSNPVVTAARTVADMAAAASATDDARVRALAGATAGLALWNARDALQADPKRLGGVRVSLMLGASRSEASGVERAVLLLPAEVAAGGDVVVRARGVRGGAEVAGERGAAGGEAGDVSVRGSLVRAGGAVVLDASRDVLLEAGEERFATSSRQASRSAGAGLGFGSGGVSVEAQASGWRGSREAWEVRRRLARVEAGGRLEVRAGRDVGLEGAVGAGERVVVRAGRDLAVRSVQDAAGVRVRERGAGASVGVGLGGGVSVSAWGEGTELDAGWRSVVERAGLRAGGEGFDVEAAGAVRLEGGVIASAEG